MSRLEAARDGLLALHGELQARLPQQQPGWLGRLREDARAAFAAQWEDER